MSWASQNLSWVEAASQFPSFGHVITGRSFLSPITWETGMNTQNSGTDARRVPAGRCRLELAERLEGYIERRASGRIRDLRVVCSDDAIILQGRSRTYHAKQLAQQAVLDLTGGYPLLTNQIVVC
jgi:hypothetical protein